MVEQMDKGLCHLAEVSRDFAGADPDYPGTGAAGGLGFGFLTFLNSTLESGVKIILEETGLEAYIREADFVITGEGRLDGQTVQGKAPVGVARLAKAWDKRVFAFSGAVTPEARLCNEAGIDAFFPILRSVVGLDEAMQEETAVKNMADTAEQVFRVVKAMQK
ncbi:MAG: glycerate kinase, partial [Lachnospiraceae bacterium]|nr:glycerate kinase [Lachnospiraceae bacterium]